MFKIFVCVCVLYLSHTELNSADVSELHSAEIRNGGGAL